MDYDPYGVPLQSGASSSFGFTGELTDPLGQVYLRARYYDPGLGVFTSLDPVEGMMGRSASYNGYGYVGGNPASYTDPSGEFPPLLLAILSGILLGGGLYAADPYGATAVAD